MSKLHNFVVAIPKLCGAKNAGRWAEINGYVFGTELSKHDSVFARKQEDIDNPENRMEVLFGFPDGIPEKVAQCKRLFRIAELSHYKAEHGEEIDNDELDALVIDATDAEVDNQDIAQVFTVDDAIAVAGWS